LLFTKTFFLEVDDDAKNPMNSVNNALLPTMADLVYVKNAGNA
jgi:hypothetical protein